MDAPELTHRRAQRYRRLRSDESDDYFKMVLEKYDELAADRIHEGLREER